jgi:Asp-tRNA(Asn)/Glu-tRNA(Gln) amidotransferase A subunit family amidase
MTSTIRLARCIAVAAFAVSISSSGAQTQSRKFDLLTATIADVQNAVDAGALTYEKLVHLYLERIEAYDKNGPRLNAVIAINPKAADTARALDDERRAKGRRSPLHGIPVAVKDNVDVADMPSAGGSLAFTGSHPARDATVVSRLRDAGAIIFLKTNMDELALGSRGLSSLGGQILDPYDLTRNPGGSSGGTGVAVSVAFATVGVATETGVSIRSPATNNAIVGIAPTRGLVSRAGVIPISFTQDRVGAHGKTVVDAARLLDVIRGVDAEDLSTAESLARSAARPIGDVDASGLRGARLGVLRDLFRQGTMFAEGNALVEQQIDALRKNGAEVITGLTTGEDLIGAMPNLRVNSFELQTAFDAYLLRRGPASPVKTFAEFSKLKVFAQGGNLAQRFQETIKAGDLNRNAEYLSRLDHQRAIRRLLVDLLERNRLDALVYPMKSLGAPPVGTSDDGPRDNNISAITGLPAIVVHAGMTAEGLPLSIELLGRPFGEPRLVEIANAYERIRGPRILPRSTPHLSGDVFSY